METAKYILRATDSNGHVFFYNGKAGPQWITPVKSEAFSYQTIEHAQHKAKLFNQQTPGHGLRFIAILA